MKTLVELVHTKKDEQVQYLMSIHYSHPKGFVGRQIIYKIFYNEEFVGVIVGGSATLHLFLNFIIHKLFKPN